MDFEKMKQWMDIAQQMHGDDFWKMIFDDEQRSPLWQTVHLHLHSHSRISGDQMRRFLQSTWWKPMQKFNT